MYANGNSELGLKALAKLADDFDASIDYLAGRIGTRKPDPNLQAAVEFTGLSEKAIVFLNTVIQRKDFSATQESLEDAFGDTLNQFVRALIPVAASWLLSSDDFWSSVIALACMASMETLAKEEEENGAKVRFEHEAGKTSCASPQSISFNNSTPLHDFSVVLRRVMLVTRCRVSFYDFAVIIAFVKLLARVQCVHENLQGFTGFLIKIISHGVYAPFQNGRLRHYILPLYISWFTSAV